MICDRCKEHVEPEDEDTENGTFSVFDDRLIICQVCSAAEMQHPLYKAALDACQAAKLAGSWAFHGIGVPQDLNPLRYCSLCGIAEDDTDFGHLGDIKVTVMDGEEGYADILQLLCDDCLAKQCDALKKLGFVDHRHGGTNLLEDEDCQGAKYGADYYLKPCPTPSEYGEYIVKSKNNISKVS